MFSLQKLFGKGDKFNELLMAAAQEAHESVRLVIELMKAPRETKNLDDLVLARRKEKKISEQISEELVKTFVTTYADGVLADIVALLLMLVVLVVKPTGLFGLKDRA